MSDELIRQVRDQCSGRLCVRRSGESYKPRKFVVTTGLGPEHLLGVCHNNIDVIERAMVERYFLCKEINGNYRPAYHVKPNSYSSKSLKSFRRVVLQHMPHLPRLSYQQVVDMYKGPKKRVYQKALESLYIAPINEEDSFLTSFVKFGKQDVSKAGRIINPRNPRYNLELGRFIKHSEHHFFNAINKAFGSHTPATVIKGYNADLSASILSDKWNRFGETVAIGLDASKFDMHVSSTALRYEHTFYQSLFPGSRRLKQLLKWQLVNRGTAYLQDGKIKFKMIGTRSSGDLNTSLGNCIIMCSLIYSYAIERNVDIELANNGDDCVVFMESSNLERFMVGFDKWFVSKGFSMTLETPVYHFCELEFCQTKPVLLSTGWRMMRNHDAILSKDPICLVPITTNSSYRKWLGAVGECGLSCSYGSPVQQAFYECLYRNGIHASVGYKRAIFNGTSMMTRIDGLVNSSVITSEARVSYYFAFGVYPDSQIEIERYYARLILDDFVVSPPILREDLAIVPNNALV